MRKIRKRTVFILFFLIIFPACIIGYAYFVEPNLLTVKSLSVKTEKEVF